jgi:hypothetical protein
MNTAPQPVATRLRHSAAMAGTLLVATAGCGRGDMAEPRADSTPVFDSPEAANGEQNADPAQRGEKLPRRRSAGRVAAIGDLHGDLKATLAALGAVGAIDERGAWVGGDLIVVQTGDQLDRGDDEPEISALLERLGREARAAGGDVIALLGNHELMNVAGDLRYVTADGFADYGGEAGRRRAFAPGSAEARRLADFPLVAIVDDTLFAHAGVSPNDVKAGLATLLAETAGWLRGERETPPRVLRDPEGPVWTRRYGRAPTPDDCKAAAEVLSALGVARMVVGHSPQPGVNAACDGAVWRIDVGLARHYGGPIEALLIENGVPRVVRGKR